MTIEEIKEAFLNKFPEYKNYLIKIDKNHRWGEKGGEILIFPEERFGKRLCTGCEGRFYTL